MKKINLLIFWFAVTSFLNAQQVLIPYKKGNQFGLVNQNGEMVVKPRFDGLNWLTGKYFISTVNSPDNELHGLFYKDKEIIKPQPSLMYRVIPEMMILAVLKENESKALRYVLYNYDGKQVESPGFGRLELIATAGNSSRDPAKERFALLYAEDFEKQPGIFIYDSDESRISEWLVKDAADFKILDKTKNNDTYYLSYTDARQKPQRKIMKITKEYFFLEDLTGDVPKPQVVGTDKNTVIKNRENEAHKPAKKSLYKEENGKLVFQDDEGAREIQLARDIVPVFKYTKIKSQTGNLIYRENRKYGWIRDGETMPAIYDSLAYFGNDHYLACLKEDSKFKCGTFDLGLKTVIPVEYDSILGVMNRFEFIPQSGTKNFELKMRTGIKGPKTEDISYSLPVFGATVAYKNGKANLINSEGSAMFPVDFDEIGQNGLKIPGEVQTEFIVLKRDGNYGVIFSAYNPESGENLQQTIEPVFSGFPAFFIKNYYEQPGYILFGLYDENGHFSSYASDFGVVYSD